MLLFQMHFVPGSSNEEDSIELVSRTVPPVLGGQNTQGAQIVQHADRPNKEESVELLPWVVRAVPMHGARGTVVRFAEDVERADKPNKEESVELQPGEVRAVSLHGGQDAAPAEGAERANGAVCVVDVESAPVVVVKKLRHFKTGVYSSVYMVVIMAIDVLVLMHWGGRVVAALIALQVLVGVVLVVLRFRSVARRPVLDEPPPPPDMYDPILGEIMNRRQWRYILHPADDISSWFHRLITGCTPCPDQPPRFGRRRYRRQFS